MLRKLLLLFSITVLFAAGVYAQTTTTTATTAATASEPAKKPPIFRPTKDQIMQVQKILIGKKLYAGEASGTYNDDTRTGIKGFQKDNGLKETGTLNRATLEKFGVELTDKQKLIPVSPNSYATPPSDTPLATTSRSKGAPLGGVATSTSPGEKGTPKTSPVAEPPSTGADGGKKPGIFRATTDQIKAAQKLLKSKSMYAGDETGKLDDATRDGLRKYQEANGLKVTGTLNAVTLEKMGIALTDSQKAMTAPAAATTAQ